MRTAWKPECRQLCVPDVIIEPQQTMLQSAHWLDRNCGHPEDVQSSYVSLKAAMQKCLFC
jgi:hypothetical protein